MSYEKKLRHVDEELLSSVRKLPCIACVAPPPSDAHHITTRGAGGHDFWDNVISLCRDHHNLFHAKGAPWMVANYPSIKTWLELAGRDDILNRASAR